MLGAELALSAVAIAMALVMARLVLWASEARTVLAASVVVFLLVMMATMFLGAWIFALAPGVPSLVLALWIAAGLMAISVFPVFTFFAQELTRRARMGPEYRPRPLEAPERLAILATGTVLVAELFMGRAFALAAGRAPGGGSWGVWGIGAATLVSPWFVLPMSVEMGATLYWLRPRFRGWLLPVLAAQAGTMALVPPASGGALWIDGTTLGAGVVMLAVYVYVFEGLFAGGRLPAATVRYAGALVVLLAVMAGGLVAWAGLGWLGIYGISVVLQTALFFEVVIVPERFAGPAGGVPELASGPGTSESRPVEAPNTRGNPSSTGAR